MINSEVFLLSVQTITYHVHRKANLRWVLVAQSVSITDLSTLTQELSFGRVASSTHCLLWKNQTITWLNWMWSYFPIDRGRQVESPPLLAHLPISPKPLLSGRWDRQERENFWPGLVGALFQMKPNTQFHSSFTCPHHHRMFCCTDRAHICLSFIPPLSQFPSPPCLLLSPSFSPSFPLSLYSPQPCLTKSQLKPALQFAHAIRDHLHSIAGD